MLGFTLRRLSLSIPTLLLASVLVFSLMRLIPGDPALLFIDELADAETLAEIRRDLGLDRSIPEQYIAWLSQMLTGDLGTSIRTGRPVLGEILDTFPVTALMVILATFIAALIAIPGGVLAAWRQNTKTDATIVGLAALCLSIPSFWSALLLLSFFGATLGWLPTVGYVSVLEDPIGGILYLIMPVTALVLTELAVLTRMSRASTIEVLRLEYVTHAFAKGVPDRTILWRHVFPNSFAPTLTVLGLILGHLLGGVVVIETMFSLPGMGRLMVDAIFARDYPIVQGVLLFTVVIYIFVNLTIDLLYPIFDPRVKL